MKLLELMTPNNPLLKRLMVSAPGTYNHSIVAANLAEAAAEAVGANPVLARVGCYFHDIGKIRRPHFFVENQADIGNIHENLSPTTSSDILNAHVTEGVELLKQYHFPTTIREIVQQHQGTISRIVVGKDRKSTRLNSSHTVISYAVFCLKKKKENK